MSPQVPERTSLRARFSNIRTKIAEHSRWRRLSRKAKIVIAMLVFLVFLLFLLNATLNRYNGYNILLLDRYITFDMPETNTVTEKQWKKLVKSAEVKKYPKAQLNREITYITNQYKKRIKEYGLTYDEYLEESDLTEEEFNNQIEDLAKQNVKEKLILHSISREKDIYVSDSEMKEAKQQLMKDRGVTNDQEYEKLTGESVEKHAEEIDLESKLLYSKIVTS
jgi:hypothetical protein